MKFIKVRNGFLDIDEVVAVTANEMYGDCLGYPRNGHKPIYYKVIAVLKNGKEIICAYYIEKEEAGKLMAEILKQLEQIEESAK